MDFIKVSRVEGVVLEWLTSHSSPAGSTTSSPQLSFYDLPAEHEGSLHLMAHHLLFTQHQHKTEFWLGYACMSTVDRRPAVTVVDPCHSATTASSQTFYPVIVHCRQFLLVRLLLPSAQAATDVFESLQGLVYAAHVERLYAFDYQPPAVATTTTTTPLGQEALLQDYQRLGVGVKHAQWRLSSVNADFQLCPTYPNLIAVPAKMSDAVLFHAAKFRSRGRLPALSFLYERNATTITRSSQPLVGIKAKRSIQDEKLIEAIFESSLASTSEERDGAPVASPVAVDPPSIAPSSSIPATLASWRSSVTAPQQPPHRNVIVDARPLGNAMANRAMGAGTESLENYKNCRRLFMGIDNIHVMRDSVQRLADASLQPDLGIDRWMQMLDASQWLKHIKSILDATQVIVKTMHWDMGHVLIHCSDGWDRTAQLSALAQLCLDPYYRTLHGFITLIEKEWIGFGHKFMDRCGFLAVHPPKISSSSTSTGGSMGSLSSSNGNIFASVPSATFTTPITSSSLSAASTAAISSTHSNASSAQRSSKEEKETAPIFLQFLEATRLLVCAYPDQFEFQERLLTDCFSALQTCQFGTFLMNCEKERVEKQIRERSHSYWSFVLHQPDIYRNPTYFLRTRATVSEKVIWPVVDSKRFLYWTAMYSRYDPPVLVPSALNVPLGTKLDANVAPMSQPYSPLPSSTSFLYPHAGYGDMDAYMNQLEEVRKVARCAAHYWKQRRKGIVIQSEDSTEIVPPVTETPSTTPVSYLNAGIQWKLGNVQLDGRHFTWSRPGTCQSCKALAPPYERLYPCWQCGRIVCAPCRLGKTATLWNCRTETMEPCTATDEAISVCNACERKS